MVIDVLDSFLRGNSEIKVTIHKNRICWRRITTGTSSSSAAPLKKGGFLTNWCLRTMAKKHWSGWTIIPAIITAALAPTLFCSI